MVFGCVNLNDPKNALNNIGYTLNNLGKTFDEKITERIYNDLPDSLKTNFTYLTYYFCHNSGKFSPYNQKCLCQVGTFKSHCQTYIIEVWGKSGFLFFQIFFGFLFFVLMIMCIFRYIYNLKNSNYNSIIYIFFTPKNLVNINLIVFTISKFIYIIIDPYCQKKKVSYIYDRVIEELKFSSIVSIYLILFIVFLGLNTNINRGKGKISKKKYICIYQTLKIIVIIILLCIYPVQIVLSIHLSTNYYAVQSISILLIVCSTLGGFLYIFTFWIICFLRDKLFKQYRIKKKNLRKERIKITKMDKINYLNEYLNEENLKLKSEETILNFLKSVMESKLKNEINIAIDKKDNNYNIDNYESMDFEKEMLILNLYQNEENKIEEEKIREVYSNEKNIQLNKVKSINDYEEDFSLNENDLKIVNDIFSFSFLYMIVTIEFILYNWAFKLPSIYQNVILLIIIIFIIHFVDIQYMIIIYVVFFKNNIIQEYKNLKYIGDLHKFTNKDVAHKIYLNYKNFKNSNIFSRLNDFINFKEDDNNNNIIQNLNDKQKNNKLNNL